MPVVGIPILLLRKVRDYAASLCYPNKLPLAPCSKKKERFACLSKLRQTNRPFSLRKVRDSNPRYDVMRTPHFECGSFDHSDNFPKCQTARHSRYNCLLSCLAS